MEKIPTIFLEQKVHRKSKQLLIQFKYHQKLIDIIKTVNGVRWSTSLKSWYLKDTPKNLALIVTLFEGITKVDTNKISSKKVFQRNLTEAQKTLLNSFYLYLKGKRYSQSTLNTYTFFVADFINFHTKIALEDLTNRNVEEFIETVFLERNYSISSQRQFISAIKIFIVFYPETKINNLHLERPKKSRQLPNVLSQEEVIEVIRVTKNLKHRAIIALIYSCGLRISELIKLELKNIDINRRQLFIQNGKGRKDRYVILADSLLPLLQNYFSTYNPTCYFVEGGICKPYSESSIRKFLHKSTKLASIQKNVTPHTLRHSYATHLLENGIGLRHIQELLGHERPETTMIYTHVAKKDLLEIKSPLDTILMNLEKNASANRPMLNSENQYL